MSPTVTVIRPRTSEVQLTSTRRETFGQEISGAGNTPLSWRQIVGLALSVGFDVN